MHSHPVITPERWEELYREQVPRLYRALLAVLQDTDAARDALHDAFAEGLRRPPARDDNLAGWLFRVALRRARRSPFRPPWLRLADLALTSATAPNEELERALDRIEVGQLLRRLTARQRAMVVAQYYLGMGQAEIAELFGVRPGTVSATVSQALARMRKGGSHAL
jgi:RNA polymerase sigma factor (sigma-70 family)